MPDLVLFQPDIPGNTGTLLRLAACMGVKVHIIEPAGFRLDEKAFRRAGMDYVEQAAMQKHLNWAEFESWRKAENRRSLAPDYVHEACDHRLTIPMAGEARSLNMALTGAMVLGEAIRQVR